MNSKVKLRWKEDLHLGQGETCPKGGRWGSCIAGKPPVSMSEMSNRFVMYSYIVVYVEGRHGGKLGGGRWWCGGVVVRRKKVGGSEFICGGVSRAFSRSGAGQLTLGVGSGHLRSGSDGRSLVDCGLLRFTSKADTVSVYQLHHMVGGSIYLFLLYIRRSL